MKEIGANGSQAQAWARRGGCPEGHARFSVVSPPSPPFRAGPDDAKAILGGFLLVAFLACLAPARRSEVSHCGT